MIRGPVPAPPRTPRRGQRDGIRWGVQREPPLHAQAGRPSPRGDPGQAGLSKDDLP